MLSPINSVLEIPESLLRIISSTKNCLATSIASQTVIKKSRRRHFMVE